MFDVGQVGLRKAVAVRNAENLNRFDIRTRAQSLDCARVCIAYVVKSAKSLRVPLLLSRVRRKCLVPRQGSGRRRCLQAAL